MFTIVLPAAEQLPPAGKLQKQVLAAANVCNISTGRLIIKGRKSNNGYLLDNVSELSVFPRKHVPRRR